MKKARSSIGIWVGQPLHFTCLVVLLILAYLAWMNIGAPLPILFWCAIAIPVLHQTFVWLAWRLELQSAAVSKAVGLNGYVAIFFVFFVCRFISLLALAWVDRGSLGFNNSLAMLLTMFLALPGIYAIYSVKRYFGMVRAAGADHFDVKYRDMPLVKGGIFRFTSNGMYLYAFLLFWAISIGFNSSASLVAAAFSHAYIWVHFYATEKPDMEFLYRANSERL